MAPKSASAKAQAAAAAAKGKGKACKQAKRSANRDGEPAVESNKRGRTQAHASPSADASFLQEVDQELHCNGMQSQLLRVVQISNVFVLWKLQP